MSWARRALVFTVALALVAGACGDDDATPEATEATTATTGAAATTTVAPATEAPTTEAATTTAAPTTTTVPEPMAPVLPPTSVTGLVDMPYKWGNEIGEATQDELPFPLGTIEAHWYLAGDRYAVVFVGLDLEASGPLCPGASIMTPTAFEHVTSSPSPGASCEGSAATIVGQPQGTQICGGVVSYLTDIPAGMLGTLYASIELYPGTGTYYGASSMADADPDNMPEIDPAVLGC